MATPAEQLRTAETCENNRREVTDEQNERASKPILGYYNNVGDWLEFLHEQSEWAVDSHAAMIHGDNMEAMRIIEEAFLDYCEFLAGEES